uniref:Uncharacterized protein n=1 Tax=Laticauda laticaudata TaxID=8630 RepID=A0A8C5RAR2_LATLA
GPRCPATAQPPLHGGYFHPVLRWWQGTPAALHARHLVYPIFREGRDAFTGQQSWKGTLGVIESNPEPIADRYPTAQGRPTRLPCPGRGRPSPGPRRALPAQPGSLLRPAS